MSTSAINMRMSLSLLQSSLPHPFRVSKLLILKLATSSTSANMGVDLKPTGEASAKPKFLEKPCCVCKDEKAARDECMLFSTAKDPQVACASMVEKYKSCMAGFGFNLP
ncbi:putative cytochrome c oxidase copper [Botrytis fragariae]|uniref:Putative cytochrome c oxidase copper n=1 Tax=Botrytis fragariae TaxID=1964551 RepID=A0A8H6EL19_9HELO|nr:putative cytochrome c oxidase copper [Botrytis fragariae]KAF5876151.1 putative cytochrome c oxidase copper [Botrytis fragariae]